MLMVFWHNFVAADAFVIVVLVVYLFFELRATEFRVSYALREIYATSDFNAHASIA